MAIQYRIAVIIKNSSDDDQFLLVKQPPPPKFADEEYDQYVDSDLWDLPSAPLNPLQGESPSVIAVQGSESCSDKLNLSKFDVKSALNQVLSQVGVRREIERKWEFWKFVEEAEFGPGPPLQTIFVHGRLEPEDGNLQEVSKWMSVQSCQNLLLEVKPSNDRVGPLAAIGLLNDLMKSGRCRVPSTFCCQEYPPGVTLVPMRSKTIKPFHTTNLVVIAPDKIADGYRDSNFAACGDALIMDPGCHSECYSGLREIVAALPRKLVVFVTHHHRDHVEGLSVIQKCNPDAILVAHENTMRRIAKDDWSLGYAAVSGAEEICIGGQRLNVIFAPGHTDGHMALLHVSTHSLIVGDHCVGQGSAILDINSGGNMKDYFQTTYMFLELSPHVLIPMHGRVNLWPKHMLCGYLKNRRQRESSILKAIEDGVETLFDIVAKTYSDVDPSFWIAASSNVRLHVDHLAHQDKIPKTVEWGKSSMIDAERCLLANALLDFSNQRFILLSESCIPLFNFITIYTYLINSTKSFLGSFDDPRKAGRGRYSQKMSPVISLSDWRKGSQWFEIHREIALEIVSDGKYYPVFKELCLPPCYMDEHYMPTLVKMVSPEKNWNRSVTWVDWSRRGPHPGKFGGSDVTDEFLNQIRFGYSCSYNGKNTTTCFLFARKFLPNSIERLLRIAPVLLGFDP